MKPEDCYAGAVARYAHMPDGPDKARLIAKTAQAIRDESELVALELPALTTDERRELLQEAVLDIQTRFGTPPDDSALDQELFDARVDDLHERLQLAAREQKADVATRAKLIQRRLVRRWSRFR